MPSSTEKNLLERNKPLRLNQPTMDHEASSCASSIILEVILKYDGPRLLMVCVLFFIFIEFGDDCCSTVSGLTIRMKP